MPINVQYIGRRPTYKDSLYGTGEWFRGEVKPVHDLTARKMLKHFDQYGNADEAEVVVGIDGKTIDVVDKTEQSVDEVQDKDVVGAPVSTEKTEADRIEAALQDARDAVMQMDLESVRQYAMTNFRQPIGANMKVENARAKVIGLIDQYGLAG